MDKLGLIMKREFLARVRNKTFIVMTFLSPLFLALIFGIISWLTSINKEKVRTIAVHDTTNLIVSELSNSEFVKYQNLSQIPLQTAKDSVVQKEFYGLLYIPEEKSLDKKAAAIRFFSDENPSIGILKSLENKLSTKITNQKLISQGLDVALIDKADTPITLQLENFTGEKSSKITRVIKMAFGGITGYLLLMFIVIYGNMIMRSVIEEKTSRIIEIIISSVQPIQLMLGKIFGTSLAGITQFLIWLIIGVSIFLVAGTFLEVSPNDLEQASALAKENGQFGEIALIYQDILNLPIVLLLSCFFIYFIGGYFLYSAIYAAIGAAVDNETDTQQFLMPIIMILVLAFYIGAFVVIEDPHGWISVLFSIIPLTSPIVMMMRIPFEVPWYEIVASIVCLFGSIIGVTWIAARIYRIGILMYGKKPTFKELAKWLRY